MALEEHLPAALDALAAARRAAANELLRQSRGELTDEFGIPHGGFFFDDEIRVGRAAIALRDAIVFEALAGQLRGADPPTAPAGLLAVVGNTSASTATITATWSPGTGGGPRSGFEVQGPGDSVPTTVGATVGWRQWSVARPSTGTVLHNVQVRAVGPGSVSAWVQATATVTAPASGVASSLLLAAGDDVLVGDGDRLLLTSGVTP